MCEFKGWFLFQCSWEENNWMLAVKNSILSLLLLLVLLTQIFFFVVECEPWHAYILCTYVLFLQLKSVEDLFLKQEMIYINAYIIYFKKPVSWSRNKKLQISLSLCNLFPFSTITLLLSYTEYCNIKKWLWRIKIL